MKFFVLSDINLFIILLVFCIMLVGKFMADVLFAIDKRLDE